MKLKDGLSLLWRYSAIVKKERRSLSKARVFFLRSFINFFQTINWLEFIDAFYKKYGFTNAPWSLAGLPIRAYASFSLKTKAKFALLQSNYREMEKVFGAERVKKLLSGQPISVATLTDKNENHYYLELAILGRYWREGGLTIYLADTQTGCEDNNTIMSTLTFSVGLDDLGKKFLLVGGLQGTNYGKSKIVEITRGLRGLRPKYLLLETCYFFATYFDVDYLVGVSNKNHVFFKQEGKVNASYDEFWQEVGGTISTDKNYLLPKKLPKRNFEEVPQKKRKDWLARQEYLKQVESDVAILFGDHSKVLEKNVADKKLA